MNGRGEREGREKIEREEREKERSEEHSTTQCGPVLMKCYCPLGSIAAYSPSSLAQRQSARPHERCTYIFGVLCVSIYRNFIVAVVFIFCWSCGRWARIATAHWLCCGHTVAHMRHSNNNRHMLASVFNVYYFCIAMTTNVHMRPCARSHTHITHSTQ